MPNYLDKITVKISDLMKAQTLGDRAVINPSGAWAMIYSCKKTKIEGGILYNAEFWLSRYPDGKRDRSALLRLDQHICGSKNYYFSDREAGVFLEKKICELMNSFLKECHINLKK